MSWNLKSQASFVDQYHMAASSVDPCVPYLLHYANKFDSRQYGEAGHLNGHLNLFHHLRRDGFALLPHAFYKAFDRLFDIRKRLFPGFPL